MAGILAIVPLLAFASLSARADPPLGELDPGMQTFGMESCASVLERSDQPISTTADCVADQTLSRLLDATFDFVGEHGQSLFGEHFQLDSRLGFSSAGGGISGELDAVIPLNSFTSISGDTDTRALFLQNGISRWRDDQGRRRNDLRFGVVHRVAVSEQPDGGVLGTSVFFQENLERGHARIVSGLDYSHQWGSGSLSWFRPTTDWKAGRFGYEERALEGVELGLRTDLTHTIALSAAAGQWESEDGSGDWTTRGRLGIGWQPHPWFGLRGNWDEVGTDDNSLGLHAVVAMPFGGGEPQRARWRGLGLVSFGSEEEEEPDLGVIWRSADNVGRLEFAERQTDAPPDPDPDPGKVTTTSASSSTLLGQMHGSRS